MCLKKAAPMVAEGQLATIGGKWLSPGCTPTSQYCVSVWWWWGCTPLVSLGLDSLARSMWLHYPCCLTVSKAKRSDLATQSIVHLTGRDLRGGPRSGWTGGRWTREGGGQCACHGAAPPAAPPDLCSVAHGPAHATLHCADAGVRTTPHTLLACTPTPTKLNRPCTPPPTLTRTTVPAPPPTASYGPPTWPL